MERKYLLIGVIIASMIMAGGLVVLQSGGAAYQEERAHPAEIPPSGEYLYMKSSLDAEAEEMYTGEGPAPMPSEQKVIKTSYISLEVESFQKAADEIGTVAKKYGGYVSDSSVQDAEGRKIGYVTIRVPQENFEDAIKEIEAVGTLQEERASLEDVTEQYIDLKARLENSKRQEERYLDILDMATTVEDVLKVETQLERIRGNIESLQGTLNYMENRITLSTVQVQLSEPEKITHESGIARAFDEAIDALLSTIRGIIIFLGYFIPIAVFLALVALTSRFVYRKWFKER